MKKKTLGKKTRRGLTRVEAARLLGVSRVSFERMVADGEIAPIAKRGAAHLYDPGELRVLRRAVKAPGVTVAVLVEDYRRHAEDYHDRTAALRELWIAEAEARPAWARHVAAIARYSASWPRKLAKRAAEVSQEDGILLACADQPKLPPPMPRRYLYPSEVLEILDGDPGSWPWKAPATPAIRRFVDAGLGIELRDDGAWIEWDPEHGIPRLRPTVRPVIAPLFSRLAEDQITEADSKVFYMLHRVEREPMPPRPTTAREAREQWRTMRAAYREARVAVRRGHVKRAALLQEVMTSIELFRHTWFQMWTGRAASVAGDYGAALALAKEIRTETLARLARFNGELTPPKGKAA